MGSACQSNCLVFLMGVVSATWFLQCLLVRVQPQAHNMAHAEGMNVGELLFGRLTGRRDPVVKSLSPGRPSNTAYR